MNISAITLQNFKGVAGLSRIELKPITLLFGPNSAGKSTLLQALVYAQEILNHNNIDPDYTNLGGEVMDLGGFERIVHAHDKNNKIIIGIELDVSDTDLPDPRVDENYDDSLLESFNENLPNTDDFLSKIDTIECQMTISWSAMLGKPFVEQLDYIVNGELIARLTSKAEITETRITKLNISHPIFELDDEKEKEKEKENGDEDEDEWFRSFIEDVLNEKHLGSDDTASIPLMGCIGSIPTKNTDLIILSENSSSNYRTNDGLSVQTFISALFNRLLGGSLLLIRERLEQLVYIGPLREVPERDMNYRRSPESSRWARGMAGWDMLHNGDKGLIKEVNHWLSDKNRLNSGYIVNHYQYRELPVETKIDEINFTDLPVRSRFTLKETQNDIEVYPRDVGVGISQVIPVIVAAIALRSSIIAIEQPELHIHPALQVALGDLFASKVNDNESLFLLETHSEHLMLRFLRRIREKHENELPDYAPEISPDDISVIYVQNTEEGVSFSQIRIDDEGEFIDRWPKGFFGERAEELF